ncbi:GGDEF domain-containing protein [Erythrobacter rubeus]|uniref:diguanylate cyclase n=1 Tax=Erythrobacter rubeus TaxID=2760803 RepID=A0ABR8KUZ7_9SPHN|nr:GGDEF domain-containing protein [Erythrobacter rubeus]MBD2842254.1 GGDEF domain-containing protein [Erythrobacter rubeus]
MQQLILGLINPLVAVIFSVTFLLMWLRNRARLDLAAFVVSYAMLGIGFIISHLGHLNYLPSVVPITHIPFSVGTIALVAGLCMRSRFKTPWLGLIGVFLASGVLLLVGHSASSSVVASLYITNTAHGVMIVMGAQIMARRPRETMSDKIVFAMVVIAAAQFFVRPAFSFIFETGINEVAFRETIYYSVLNATIALGSLVLALTLIAASIQDEFRNQRTEMEIDPLSGLLSRQSFETKVEEVLAAGVEEDTKAALIIADIDHFKNVNDIWGHQTGDRAIAEFGALIAREIRYYDLAGRIGGEEFCILIRNADTEAALGLAERLRRKLSATQIEGMSDNVRLTASFGATHRKGAESYKSMFTRADKALYVAKDTGRDRVIISEDQTSEREDTPAKGSRQAAA